MGMQTGGVAFSHNSSSNLRFVEAVGGMTEHGDQEMPSPSLFDFLLVAGQGSFLLRCDQVHHQKHLT